VMMEVMAGGVLAAGSDIPGVCDLIVPGETGWMFPYGDADALAQVMTSAMDDRAAAQRMALAGQARVLENFSAQRMAQEYQQLFVEIMNRAGGAA